MSNVTEIATLIEDSQLPVAADSGSSRAPVTRQEERQVRAVNQVTKPKRRDPLDLGTVQAADLSPLAVQVENFEQAGFAITPQMQHDHALMTAAINQRWNEAQAMMAESTRLEKTGEYGRSSLMLTKAGVHWAEANELRAAVGNLEQFAASCQVADFQRALLNEFPWLRSAKVMQSAISWAAKTYNCTEDDVVNAAPEQIVAACQEYEKHARKRNAPLPRETVDQKIRASKAVTKAQKARREGRQLSQAERADLIAEMLRTL